MAQFYAGKQHNREAVLWRVAFISAIASAFSAAAAWFTVYRAMH